MEQYRNFWQVTQEVLDFACATYIVVNVARFIDDLL